jgi:formamidopyrimidine-DNA glycosylase
MIELPEAITIAKQMNATLSGREIAHVMVEQTPHKFAFYSRTPQEYAERLVTARLGYAQSTGPLILLTVEPDQLLVFGYGGERILFHPDRSTLPAKHQFLMEFSDGACLSVTVQGWGFCQLLEPNDLPGHPQLGQTHIEPLSEAFSLDMFQDYFKTPAALGKKALKFFMISDPGVWGVGNGCLQDILFNARLDPRRQAASLNPAEQEHLYMAIRNTLGEMAALGGREDERDLFSQPGGYAVLMSNATAGQPCPNCGAAIQKISLLGGSCYYCPACQV